MHVDHLLRLDRLDLSLVWGDEALLGREIAGVTATDLEDPERFLQPGEVVLSGLVWWSRDGAPDKTDRFVSALRRAGAVTLLAGEETHGHVPRELVDRAFAHLGTPACHLLTPTGRTVARTGGTAGLSAREAVEVLRGGRGTTLRVEAEGTDFDTWYLHLPQEGRVPPRVLQEISELLGRHRRRRDRRRAARDAASDRLVEAVGAPRADTDRLRGALASCGLADRAAYTVAVAALAPDGNAGADGVAALAEALGHLPSVAFAVARGTGDGAVAVLAHEGDAEGEVRERLREVWPLVRGCRPEGTWQVGVSMPVTAPTSLNTALAQARHALAAAPALAPPVAGLRDLGGLALLLAGVPADVRDVYRTTVLGPLLGAGRGSGAMLLETLEVFLAHDCSWTRTAEALHIHVNTVHYRVERIEVLTGRDLSRLDDRVDLRAALLCR
ncbi:helix-turn-helix domain-containing protein [Streptomyces cinereoruber]|uniref:helix-turn-helix domain-containing protein n=1 Tax=Streptomyces cinereoruber TaxID=67260 RepID=UPI00364054E9